MEWQNTKPQRIYQRSSKRISPATKSSQFWIQIRKRKGSGAEGLDTEKKLKKQMTGCTSTGARAVGNVGIGARVTQATNAFGKTVESLGQAVVVAVAPFASAGSDRSPADQGAGGSCHGATGRSAAVTASGRCCRERHEIRHRTGRVVCRYGGARCRRAQHRHILVNCMPILSNCLNQLSNTMGNILTQQKLKPPINRGKLTMLRMELERIIKC